MSTTPSPTRQAAAIPVTGLWRWRWAVAMLPLAATLGSPAVAAPVMSARATATSQAQTYDPTGGGNFEQGPDVNLSDTGGSVLAKSIAGTLSGGFEANGSAFALAFVTPGNLKAHSWTNPNAEGWTPFVDGLQYGRGAYGTARASADVSIREQLVFWIGDLLPGTQFYADYRVYVSGDLSSSADNVASDSEFRSWSSSASTGAWEASLGGQWMADEGDSATAHQFGFGLVTTTNPLDVGTFTRSALLTVGANTELFMQLGAGSVSNGSFACFDYACNGHYLGVGEAEADLGHSLNWGGITGLRTRDGRTLSLDALRVQSESGFDYRFAFSAAGTGGGGTPVPAPAPAALLLAAALAAGLARRRA